MTSTVRADLASHDDIVRLVNAFYDRVRGDDLLGPIFNDIAKVDWDEHLPKMYAFWSSVLFGTTGFRGNPLAVHRALAQRTPLTGVEFDRWVTLFHTTIDELFSGRVADDAKVRVLRIAATMQYHIEADRSAVT